MLLCTSFIYKHVNLFNFLYSTQSNRYVQSYHIKTIFLWYCEQTSQTEFTEDSIVPRVYDLLRSLQSCLTAKHCPHYFIPSNNLFQYISDAVIKKTLRNVNVSIEKADDIWINNRGLFLLPSTRLTRVSISIEMTNLFLSSMKRLFASLLDKFVDTKQQVSGDGQGGSNVNTACIESETDQGIEAINTEDGEDIDYGDSKDEDSDNDDSDDEDIDDLSINSSKTVFWEEVATGVIETFKQLEQLEDGNCKDITTVLEIIFQVTVNNMILDESIYQYLCTRITPRNIVRLERHSGLIKSFAELLSYIGSYGDVLQSLMDRKKRDYDD